MRRSMKIHHLRWYICGLLFTATVINYVDRQTLSIVAPLLTKELGMSEIDYANVLQAFLIPYTAMYVVTGILVDRWGTRCAMSVFMVWWSVSNALHMFARNVVDLGIFRALLGIGEPGNFMAASKAISEWYPPRERAFANGMVNAGSAVGAVISAPLVVWITLRFGWRFAFLATGSLGFVWLVAWLYLYRLPELSSRITEDELRHIRNSAESEVPQGAARTGFLALLGYRETWGLLLAGFFSDPVWWFYLFWMPKYLVEHRGFTLTQVGMLAWVPYLTADIGSLAGGLFSGRLIARKWPVLRARSLAMLLSVVLMPLSMVIASTRSSAIALLLICTITFCHMAWKTNLMTLRNDIFPTHIVGSVSGIVSIGSGLGGALFTSLVGHVVERYSYASIFAIMGLLHPAAFVICYLALRKTARRRLNQSAEVCR